MELFLFLCVAAALLIWVRGRIAQLEERASAQERRIASLTERIFVLEGRAAAATAPPVLVAPPPTPVAPPPVVHAQAVPPMEVAGPAPEPPRDLESTIGGNWLSKLGVLMLLIGVALFLGFSLTAMGPMGRILTGLATSLALLGAGIAAERKDNYRVLGSALLGGGWAGLYFTAFAAHGVAASRVIESAGAGFLLLLAVTTGMILHSLRYRNQTVTGLAYMAAFLTIAISSLTLFSAVASVPLLVSLLVVAWRFGWQPLAAAGALLAYAAYGFDLATGDKDRYFLSIGEPVLWIYWVILETFDLASVRRGVRFPIGPLNLTGFLFAMAAVWPRGGGWQPGVMLGAMAAAQLVSAVLRGRTTESTAGGYQVSTTFSALFAAAFILDRFTGLERGLALALLAQAIAVSGWLLKGPYLRGLGAALFVLPIAANGPDLQRPLFWTLSALFLLNRMYLAGGVWYSIGLVVTLAGLGVDFEPAHLRPVLVTIAAGTVGLALRWRRMPEARWTGLALGALSVLMLVARMPEELIWVSIGLPAMLYAVFGWAIPEGVPRLATFVMFQFYAGALLYRLIGQTPWLMAAWLGVSAVSWAVGLLRTGPSLAGSALMLECVALAFWAADILGRQNNLAALAVAAALLFAMYLTPVRIGDALARMAAAGHGVAATVVTTLLLQDFVSGRRLTLAWGLEAFALLGAGIGLQRRPLRLSGLALFGLCLLKVFFRDFAELDTLSRILSFIVLGLLLIAASWVYSRFRDQVKQLL
jgi:uncharacterized membrane protein